MSSVATEAIVLRHANYGESNRMLTLLSPTLGLLSAAARGSRKATSRNLTATELFTAGEFLLYQKGEHYTLTSFQLRENYYPLRTDVDRLTHGVYWLNLCEAAAQPGEDASRLFKMLLLSLAVLAYGDKPPRPLTAVFLVQFSTLQGFAPMLDHCTRCGKPLAPPMRFDDVDGGACCSTCTHRGQSLSESGLAWLREAQSKGAFMLAGRRALPQAGDPHAAEEPLQAMRAHVEHRLERRIASGRLF